jgi:hypothetical protein
MQAEYQTRISLYVGKGRISAAVETLAASGYAASPNGKKIWVKVPSNLKADPIRVLIEAGIPVRDFDFEYSLEANQTDG